LNQSDKIEGEEPELLWRRLDMVCGEFEADQCITVLNDMLAKKFVEVFDEEKFSGAKKGLDGVFYVAVVKYREKQREKGTTG
jgi:hypothetical protein